MKPIFKRNMKISIDLDLYKIIIPSNKKNHASR